jgi:adenylate cyclase
MAWWSVDSRTSGARRGDRRFVLIGVAIGEVLTASLTRALGAMQEGIVPTGPPRTLPSQSRGSLSPSAPATCRRPARHASTRWLRCGTNDRGNRYTRAGSGLRLTPASTLRNRLARCGIGLAIGAAAALLAFALGRTPFVGNIELLTYDWRMRLTARPARPSDDIVLVSIDDDSVRRMAASGFGRWPWPRLIHGYLVDYLTRAPAKVIVYDVLFTEPDAQTFNDGERDWSGAESDDELVKSVRRAGNVIVAGDAAAERLLDPTRALTSLDPRPTRVYQHTGGCISRRDVFVPPIASLDNAALDVGHTLLVRDPDGPLRRFDPFITTGDRVVPSLAMAAALAARAGGVRQPSTCPPLIAYRGPTIDDQQRPSFSDYSFYTLFASEQQILEGATPEVDPAVFKGKIVVVGATASGTYEVQNSPFGPGVSGGEVHAHIIDALLSGRTIEPAPARVTAAATVGLPIAVGLSGAVAGIWPLVIVAALAAGVFAWATVWSFAAGSWVVLMPPLLGIGLAFVAQLAWQYFVEGREKRQVKRLFSRYVPRDVYEQLLANPEGAALGGKRRVMTVLFSDVRGFTAMSEKSTPEEVVAQLNEYFSRMVDVLFAHHGTLDKFVGDMVMGLFGAPVDDPDHAEHAVQAAVAMTRALDELNRNWAAAGRPILDIGIGISTGDMVAGNIGSESIMSYTVIGDTVNLGARLESLNKEYGTHIIISEATRAALRRQYDIRPLGEVIVKGKSRPIAIYEVKSA